MRVTKEDQKCLGKCTPRQHYAHEHLPQGLKALDDFYKADMVELSWCKSIYWRHWGYRQKHLWNRIQQLDGLLTEMEYVKLQISIAKSEWAASTAECLGNAVKK